MIKHFQNFVDLHSFVSGDRSSSFLRDGGEESQRDSPSWRKGGYIMVMLLTENIEMGFNNMSNNDDDDSNIQAHAEEIDHLRKTSQQLKSQLEGILHKK